MHRRVLLLSLVCVGLARSDLDAAIRTSAKAQGFLTIRKVPVVDCRVVRGFLGTLVDGSVRSWDYRGTVREYPRTASDGVAYAYLNNDGAHIRLAEGESFNVVVLRGGAKARVYVDVNGIVEPSAQEPLCRFAGGKEVETVCLDRLVTAREVSFFGVEGGIIADVAFYRVQEGQASISGGETWTLGAGLYDPPPPQSQFAPESIYLAMKERYGDKRQVAVPLVKEGSGTRWLSLKGGWPVHLVSDRLGDGRGLSAIDLTMKLSGAAGPRLLTMVIQDPLNPRLDLIWVELEVQVPGSLGVRLDIPDQVMLENSRLWLTLRSDKDVDLEKSQFGLHFVSREQALPEALVWRKLLMKSFYSLLSEPRPWGAYAKQPREQFYASSSYAAQCPELFMTIDQCHALAPTDSTVRQYREWVYLRNLQRLSVVAPPPEPPAGVPAWAWYPRLAWLEVRRIAQWWLDERRVPTGEFRGRVGDDSDLYQQFADLPFFEDTGVGARLLDSGAKLAELADKENLREGLNLHATDSLHAYEEGINHLALMARWFYGDPIHLERCMESARNMEALTIGPDTNDDFQADKIEIDKSIELARADSIPLAIQPGSVAVVTLERQRELDPLLTRADLAIARREVEFRDGVVSGTVHNVGSADVDDVVVAIVTADGRTVARKSLGPLAAPVDLVPRRLPFALPLPEPSAAGWRLVLDPDSKVSEIYKGNNEVTLVVTP